MYIYMYICIYVYMYIIYINTFTYQWVRVGPLRANTEEGFFEALNSLQSEGGCESLAPSTYNEPKKMITLSARHHLLIRMQSSPPNHPHPPPSRHRTRCCHCLAGKGQMDGGGVGGLERVLERARALKSRERE